MRKLLILIVLGTVSFAGSTCKKIRKSPVSMFGKWVSKHSMCDFMLLDIKKNGVGRYGPGECCKGCEVHRKGRVRFDDKNLYVGPVKFQFISKPIIVEGNDSIKIAAFAKSRILAKMTLKETTLYGGHTYTYFKIENY